MRRLPRGRSVLRPALFLFAGLLLLVTLFGSYTRIQYHRADGWTRIAIYGLLLPTAAEAERNLTILPEMPGMVVHTAVTRPAPWRLEIWLKEQGDVTGRQLRVVLQNPAAPTPWFRARWEWQVRKPVIPRLLSLPGVMPSRGPLLLAFNTPVDPESVAREVRFSAEGEFRPWRPAGGSSPLSETVDYSRWFFYPRQPLENGGTYRLEIGSGLKALSGRTLRRTYRLPVRIPPALHLLAGPPGGEAEPYIEMSFTFDQPLAAFHLQLEPNVAGRVSLQGAGARWFPDEELLPGRRYEVRGLATSAAGETLEIKFNLQVIDIPSDRFWIAVDLVGPNEARVYQGRKLIRSMTASGGSPEEPTPRGRFRVHGRGRYFFSWKYQQGAYYWVRFLGNYLFHSIPFDRQWRLIPEEAEQLGCPVSHGCVRLTLEDARWIYENIPDGTAVYIFR